jgi:hypothetical protein
MARLPFALRASLVGVGAVAFVSCGSLSRQENAGPCPNAFALLDAARIVEFSNPGAEDFENVSYTAEIEAVRTLCRYVKDRPINADVELEIGFGRGPAASDNDHTYNLWVAVTRTDVAILDRVTIPIRVNFPRGEDRVYLRREINNIIIPRAEESTSGTNFEILIGFEVTPEQLEFNRLGKRFTIDAARGE